MGSVAGKPYCSCRGNQPVVTFITAAWFADINYRLYFFPLPISFTFLLSLLKKVMLFQVGVEQMDFSAPLFSPVLLTSTPLAIQISSLLQIGPHRGRKQEEEPGAYK